MKRSIRLIEKFSVAVLLALSFVSMAKAQSNAQSNVQSNVQSNMQSDMLKDKLSAFDSVKKIYNKNAPAVVKVIAAKKDENGKQFLLVGTGFFIDKQGHLITNAAIAYKAESLWIDSNGAPSKATLVGLDPITNVSVLKVETNGVQFPVVDLETSSRLPEIADALLMISCELGQDVSPNLGLITGHNISFGEKILPTVYLRTSIPIYGGSVGAPIFSLSGEFKGMAVAAIPELDGSFVLPARALNRIKDDILLAQKVVYGWFGLISREIADNINGVRVVIDVIVPDSPAAKAGFEVGDVILAINGRKVVSDRDLRWETFFVRAGELATLRVRRQDKEMDINLEVGRMNTSSLEVQKTQTESISIKIQKKAEAKAE